MIKYILTFVAGMLVGAGSIIMLMFHNMARM